MFALPRHPLMQRGKADEGPLENRPPTCAEARSRRPIGCAITARGRVQPARREGTRREAFWSVLAPSSLAHCGGQPFASADAAVGGSQARTGAA